MNKVSSQIKDSLRKRHASEKKFKFFGLSGIFLALGFLIIILSTIFLEGKKAFVYFGRSSNSKFKLQ